MKISKIQKERDAGGWGVLPQERWPRKEVTLSSKVLVPVPMFLQTKGSHMVVMFCSGDSNNDCLEMLFLGEIGGS